MYIPSISLWILYYEVNIFLASQLRICYLFKNPYDFRAEENNKYINQSTEILNIG